MTATVPAIRVERTGATAVVTIDRQELLVASVRSSADSDEGARAFAEKRVPRWQGR